MSEETKQFYDLTVDDSREVIVQHLQNRLKTVFGSVGITKVEYDSVTSYLLELLKLKDQNDFNEEMVQKQGNLVRATWVLAIVTIIVTVLQLFKTCE